jgi:hypothetical protein
MANQGAGLEANKQSLYGSSMLGQLGQQQQQMGYADSNALLGIGNQQQAQAQSPLDFAYQQYLMGQNWDQSQLQFLQGFLKDPRGVAQSTPQPSTGLGVLGGAMTGMNIANGIYGAYNNQAQPVTQLGSYAMNLPMQGTGPINNVPLPTNFWTGG